MSSDPYPQHIEDCIKSWHEVMPDYKIIKWDANNFDVNMKRFTREAMEMKKYAFVSDYVRLYALYNYGGIYLDADVKVFQRFDDLLKESKFFTGFEHNNVLGVWLLGAEKNNEIIGEMLKLYDHKKFIQENGELDLTPNPVILTPIVEREGIVMDGSFQNKNGIVIYPVEFFCPFNPSTGAVKKTEKSYAMHLFEGAWMKREDRMVMKKTQILSKKMNRFLGETVSNMLARFMANYSVGGGRRILKKISSKICIIHK